eukprot:Nk52_evm71s2367 gene=Nk52_evmTU71s2367
MWNLIGLKKDWLDQPAHYNSPPNNDNNNNNNDDDNLSHSHNQPRGACLKKERRAPLQSPSVGRGCGARLYAEDGEDVALFYQCGQFFAMEGNCAHEGGPLELGDIEDLVVVCPWHQFEFSLHDGVSESSGLQQIVFEVKEVEFRELSRLDDNNTNGNNGESVDGDKSFGLEGEEVHIAMSEHPDVLISGGRLSPEEVVVLVNHPSKLSLTSIDNPLHTLYSNEDGRDRPLSFVSSQKLKLDIPLSADDEKKINSMLEKTLIYWCVKILYTSCPEEKAAVSEMTGRMWNDAQLKSRVLDKQDFARAGFDISEMDLVTLYKDIEGISMAPYTADISIRERMRKMHDDIAKNHAQGEDDAISSSKSFVDEDNLAVNQQVGESATDKNSVENQNSEPKTLHSLVLGSYVPPLVPPRQKQMSFINPGDAPRRGKCGNKENRIAMLHSLANIEQWAIDLSWDIIARFGLCKTEVGGEDYLLPDDFVSDFIQVAVEEGKHFHLLSKRIEDLGMRYGDLPVHGGLWDSALETKHCVLARLAIVHMVHEARGLDVHPKTIERFKSQGDKASVKDLEVIYEEEITHVKAGMRWFVHASGRLKPETEPRIVFHEKVKQYFKGFLKPPFNKPAREEAGMAEDWYMPLVKPHKGKKLE